MFANKLHQFLKPLIGDAPAKRLILNYSAQVNRPPQLLTQNDLPDLGRYLAENINAFVGAEQAKQITQILKGLGNQQKA